MNQTGILDEYRERVLSGKTLSRDEALSLYEAQLEPLCQAADGIRRAFCGDGLELCAIANGKSGRCPENCRYCAQSAHYHGPAESYPLMDTDSLLSAAKSSEQAGALRFSVVTSGRRLQPSELMQLAESYRRLHQECHFSLCASHGLLEEQELAALKAAGVSRYHCNLETSRRFFPQICTTHTFEDKIHTLRAAKAAGLSLCSGGILGLGETRKDRVDMAFTLRELGVKSVPLNVLNPIPGTPLADLPPLGEEELLRTMAIFRFLLPDAALRLAGGRLKLPDKGRAAFRAGANAAITGDMLTTGGVGYREDYALAQELGFEVKRL